MIKQTCITLSGRRRRPAGENRNVQTISGGQRNMKTTVTVEGIDQAVEQARPTIERLALELWQLSELSLQEVQSARLIMDTLQEEGFTIPAEVRPGYQPRSSRNGEPAAPFWAFWSNTMRCPGLAMSRLLVRSRAKTRPRAAM